MDEKELLELLCKQSVQNFYSMFPNEQACLELFPTICPNCGPTTPVELEVERSFTCSICRKVCWRTAGTFFERSHRVSPGFLLVWLLEDQIIFSINQFKNMAACSYSSAWELHKRMRELLMDEMLQARDSFDVTTIVFDEVIYRRSKLTPAAEHPRLEGLSEMKEIESQVEIEPTFQSVQEKNLFHTLSSEPKHIEIMAEEAGIDETFASLIVTGWELGNVVTRLPGERFTVKQRLRVDLDDLRVEQISVIAEFLNFAKRRGLSRKHLQLTVAQFWATTNKVKWRATTLFNTCMKYSKLGFRSFRNYVSPPVVSMVSPQA